ncbi:hypothetical protein [Methylobacterium phyllostachyos]|nr:hypothetical protein [Methylobacterium phyllostachyos]
MHRASVAAGDSEALAIEEAYACAKAEVLAYAVPTAKQAPG